jgi:hypothetical protein
VLVRVAVALACLGVVGCAGARASTAADARSSATSASACTFTDLGDAALPAEVARCVRLPPHLRLADARRDGVDFSAPHRAALGPDGTAVWLSLRSEAAGPSWYGGLLLWIDARGRGAWQLEPDDVGVPAFEARVESLAGERVLVEKMGGMAMACAWDSPCDFPEERSERVVLRRDASLEQAGSYLVSGGEPREDAHAPRGKVRP